mgnify:CR=1 FL=1
MSHFTLLKLPTFADGRGALSVLDGTLPFPTQRIYWIYGSDGKTRGGHRHMLTRQALIAVHGSVSVHMDDGLHAENILLESPDQCLLVDPKDWHTMTFTEGSVLLVIASHPFDRNDYVDEGYK